MGAPLDGCLNHVLMGGIGSPRILHPRWPAERSANGVPSGRRPGSRGSNLNRYTCLSDKSDGLVVLSSLGRLKWNNAGAVLLFSGTMLPVSTATAADLRTVHALTRLANGSMKRGSGTLCNRHKNSAIGLQSYLTLICKKNAQGNGG